MSDYSNISVITYVYYGIAVPSQSTQNRVILIFFLRLAYAGFFVGVRRVCARLGADGYLRLSSMS